MKQRKITTRVVLHHSLSDHATVDEITQWHKERGFETIGYHFVIQKDGKIDSGRPIEMVGAHAMGNNADSVGVCLVGNLNNYHPTKEQIEAAKALFSKLNNFYGKLKLEFHHELCPGSQLDRVEFKKVVADE